MVLLSFWVGTLPRPWGGGIFVGNVIVCNGLAGITVAKILNSDDLLAKYR